MPENEDRRAKPQRSVGSAPAQEPRGVQPDLAEDDKRARTGAVSEPVRNTPPAGAWNDTSHD